MAERIPDTNWRAAVFSRAQPIYYSPEKVRLRVEFFSGEEETSAAIEGSSTLEPGLKTFQARQYIGMDA